MSPAMRSFLLLSALFLGCKVEIGAGGEAPVLQRAQTACFAAPSLAMNLLVSGRGRSTSDRAKHGRLVMGNDKGAMGKGGKVDGMDIMGALSTLQASTLSQAPSVRWRKVKPSNPPACISTRNPRAGRRPEGDSRQA